MAPTTPLPKYLREDNITQQCKELLPSLMSEEDCWIGSRLYLYQGFWFRTAHLNGILSCRKNFRARGDDVILSTMPKSGTTWLKAILFELSNRSTGQPKPNPLLTTNPHDLVPYLEMNLFVENEDPDLSSFKSPRVFATHTPYPLLPESIRDSECKVVYLCRNVKDNFTASWHFAHKISQKERGEYVLEEVFNKYCRGVSPFGPMLDHALGYWKASLEMPEKVLFLKYEDMKERPMEIVKKLAKFIGRPFYEGEDEDKAANEILQLCSFDSLSKLEVNKTGKLQSGEDNKVFFRKGEVGDWMNLLSFDMADQLDRITEEKLSGSGLKL